MVHSVSAIWVVHSSFHIVEHSNKWNKQSKEMINFISTFTRGSEWIPWLSRKRFALFLQVHVASDKRASTELPKVDRISDFGSRRCRKMITELAHVLYCKIFDKPRQPNDPRNSNCKEFTSVRLELGIVSDTRSVCGFRFFSHYSLQFHWNPPNLPIKLLPLHITITLPRLT